MLSAIILGVIRCGGSLYKPLLVYYEGVVVYYKQLRILATPTIIPICL
jgi:hypothetical protein